jgi:hypothetical protein
MQQNMDFKEILLIPRRDIFLYEISDGHLDMCLSVYDVQGASEAIRLYVILKRTF